MLFLALLFLSSIVFGMDNTLKEKEEKLKGMEQFLAHLEGESQKEELLASLGKNDTKEALQVIKNMKKIGVRLGRYEGGVLEIPVINNNVDIVQAILDKDPEVIEQEQVLGSVKSRAMVDLLLSKGANPNKKGGQRGFTPLYGIIYWANKLEPNIEVIEALLKAGADPNDIQRSEGGICAPLAEAAYNGFRAVCVKLIEYGADPLLPNEKSNALTNARDCLVKELIIKARNERLDKRLQESPTNVRLKNESDQWYSTLEKENE